MSKKSLMMDFIVHSFMVSRVHAIALHYTLDFGENAREGRENFKVCAVASWPLSSLRVGSEHYLH